MMTEMNQLLDDINKSSFFKRDSIYSEDPVWYFADFEIKEKHRNAEGFRFLVLKIGGKGEIGWIVTNRSNGEIFNRSHGLRTVSKEYAVDILSEDEDILGRFAELTPILFG